MDPKDMTDDDWRSKLTPEQYAVLRKKGTEIPGTGTLLHNKDEGVYTCAGCGSKLFTSDAKYDSTMPGLIGWPSFTEAADEKSVLLQDDDSLGMQRVEAVCAACGGHLGHLFDDPSSPNGKHFCINSTSLDFEKQSD